MTATLIDTGDGISVTLYGGDRGHIGAISIKTPGEEAVTRELPGHREGIVAEKWAERLSEHFGCTVVVSCGIHYDGITKEGILEVLQGSDELLEGIL